MTIHNDGGRGGEEAPFLKAPKQKLNVDKSKCPYPVAARPGVLECLKNVGMTVT